MPTARRMLIADDNRQIVSILEAYAKKEGFEVIAAYDGGDALAKALAPGCDVILLDVMMPGQDGFAVCRAIREASDVPVIMVTARGEDYERIMGLDIGADDYIVKPFSPAEVMARVRAVLRRMPRGAAQTLALGSLCVDLGEYVTRIDGAAVPLTKKETELLWTLVKNKNRALTRQSLLDSVWGFDYDGDMRTVDSHVKRLRAKLDELPHPGWEIRTIWGVGYKLEVTQGC